MDVSLNNSEKTGPMRDRSDFNDALTTLSRLHQESGERQLRRDKLFNSFKVPNQTNQIQNQNMIERGGHPLFSVTQVARKEPPKHVPLMKARTSTLETKQIMIER